MSERKKKIVFNDQGEVVDAVVDEPVLNIRPKNTAQSFEELKVVSSNRKADVKKKTKRERDELYRVDSNNESAATKKPKKEKKELPPGYVCAACGAVDLHAIYDCTIKVSKKQLQAVSQTVWIEGLPLGSTLQRIKDILAEHKCSAAIRHKGINLICFSDSHKCKGMASVTFETKEGAQECITKLHGAKILRDATAGAAEGEGEGEGEEEGGASTEKKSRSKGKSSLVLKVTSFNPGEKAASAASASQRVNGNGQRGAGAVKHEKVKRCFRCGGVHDSATCTEARVCYRCKSTEHLSSACPLKKTKGGAEGGGGEGGTSVLPSIDRPNKQRSEQKWVKEWV